MCILGSVFFSCSKYVVTIYFHSFFSLFAALLIISFVENLSDSCILRNSQPTIKISKKENIIGRLLSPT